MDWTDPGTLQFVAPLAVAALAPLVVWIGRKWSPDFHFGPKWQKRLVAILVTAVPAFLATPGTWWQKLLAAAGAVALSQGGYFGLKAARN